MNVLLLRQDEKVRAVIDTRDYGEGRYLLFGTRNGVVKKTEFKAYDTVLRADGSRIVYAYPVGGTYNVSTSTG